MGSKFHWFESVYHDHSLWKIRGKDVSFSLVFFFFFFWKYSLPRESISARNGERGKKNYRIYYYYGSSFSFLVWKFCFSFCLILCTILRLRANEYGWCFLMSGKRYDSLRWNEFIFFPLFFSIQRKGSRGCFRKWYLNIGFLNIGMVIPQLWRLINQLFSTFLYVFFYQLLKDEII